MSNSRIYYPIVKQYFVKKKLGSLGPLQVASLSDPEPQSRGPTRDKHVTNNGGRCNSITNSFGPKEDLLQKKSRRSLADLHSKILDA